MKLKEKIYQFLRWLQNYTKTDMVYVVENSFWWIFGRIFSFLASFLILMAFARFATKEVYGAYQYIISMFGMISLIFLPGLDTALVRSIAKQKEKTFFLCEKEKLKFGVFALLVFCAISFWYFFHKNFELAISFFVAGIFSIPLAVFSLYSAFWQGKKRFDLQNKYFVLHNLLAALILISLIIFSQKITLIVFGYFFGFTFATFLFWILTRKKINKEGEEDKEAIPFGKHLTIMAIPVAISSQIDNVILWQFKGPAQVAIYAYALRLVERISELIPFSALAFPKMAEKNLKANGVKKSIFDKFLKLFWFSIPFTILYILFCPIFFKIFFPAYKESVIYSQILALILVFSPFSFLVTAILAEAKKRELYILNFAPQILKIILFFVLIPIFGIWGGVFSILISQIFFSILTLHFFHKL
jgi:O-antigen/teichoic acid export membrane protein